MNKISKSLYEVSRYIELAEVHLEDTINNWPPTLSIPLELLYSLKQLTWIRNSIDEENV